MAPDRLLEHSKRAGTGDCVHAGVTEDTSTFTCTSSVLQGEDCAPNFKKSRKGLPLS